MSRWQALKQYPFLVGFGIALFVAGLEPVVGVAPPSPTIAQLPDGLEVWWQVFYSVGGITIALGLVTRRRSLETLGLAMVAGAFIVQGMLTLSAFGASGRPGATFLWITALFCIIRYVVVLRAHAER